MNLKAEFVIKKLPAVVSVTDICSDKPCVPNTYAPITTHILKDAPANWYSGLEQETCNDTCNIKSAKSIIVAGRGTKSKEGYAKVVALSELLEAKTGSTRPLVQEAVAPQNGLIGASGAIVSPSKCLILGASGAAPFAAGVEKSGTIFGVNNDPDAMLFSFCDFGVVDDCNLIVESLLQQLKAEDGNDE
jgi:electron transfer flavoprotein alpha subunit